MSVLQKKVFKRQRQRNCTAFSRCAMTLLERRGFWYVLHMSVTCLSHVCHMSKKITTRTMCFRWMSEWRVHVSLSKPTCRDELACCACKCITCKSIKTTPRSPTSGNQHQSMCICRNGVSNQTQAGPPHHLHLKAAGYLEIRSPCLSRIVWKHVWSKLCRRWAGLWLNTLELPAERLT